MDVAHEAGIFCALYGRSFEEPAIVVLAQLLPLLARHGEQFLARLELGDVGGVGETVPGACQLATVASVDERTHLRLGVVAQLATVFDGLVGKAEMGVERMGVAQRMGRTLVDAAVAMAAMVGHGLVVIELYVEKQLAQEKLASGLGDDEQMVASHPS